MISNISCIFKENEITERTMTREEFSNLYKEQEEIVKNARIRMRELKEQRIASSEDIHVGDIVLDGEGNELMVAKLSADCFCDICISNVYRKNKNGEYSKSMTIPRGSWLYKGDKTYCVSKQ